MEHEAALITSNRAICRCGWHKKTQGKGNAQAAMIRHVAHPQEPATLPTEADHTGEGCKVTVINRKWSACITHDVYLIPKPAEPANQEELSFP